MSELSYNTLIRLGILLLIFFILFFSLNYKPQSSISKKNFTTLKKDFTALKPNVPKLARVLYLFLCENQGEINTYSNAFPSVTADVMFFCWKENCNVTNTNVTEFATFYVGQWSESVSKHQPFVRFDPEIDYIKIQPRTFIINEHQLNLSTKTTWTKARNLLLERAFIEEHRQGWRWAYFNFGDGDIQIDCSPTKKLLDVNKTDRDKTIFAEHFYSLIKNTINSDQCFLLFDIFLLSVSPAIGVIGGMHIPIIYEGLLAQIVYHIDAMFNAFHRDAIPFVLPYCGRYDNRTWWTSQAILVYRSLCLYGHVIQFNGILVIGNKHRGYPKGGDPWSIDEDMDLVPPSLIPFQKYMRQERVVSSLVLQHYGGWSLEMASNECRQQQTFMNPFTCKVSGD